MSVWARVYLLIFQWLLEPVYLFCVAWMKCLPWFKEARRPPILTTYLLSWYLPFLLTTSTFSSLFFGHLLIENLYPLTWNKSLFLTVLATDYLYISGNLWPFMVDGTEILKIMSAHTASSFLERIIKADYWTSLSSFSHEVLAVHWFVCQRPSVIRFVAVCARVPLLIGFHQTNRTESSLIRLCALRQIWVKIRDVLDTQWSPYLIWFRMWQSRNVSNTTLTGSCLDVLWSNGYRTDLNRFVQWSTGIRVTAQLLLFLLNCMAQALESLPILGVITQSRDWMAEVYAMHLALKFTVPFVDLMLAVYLTGFVMSGERVRESGDTGAGAVSGTHSLYATDKSK